MMREKVCGDCGYTLSYCECDKKMTKKQDEICPDCKGLIKIRNPTGKCDHLYYPDNKPKKDETCHVAATTKEGNQTLSDKINEIDEEYYHCKDDSEPCDICKIREDVKNFIKKLKDDYDKRIDIIQNSFKETDDPYVAMKRFELMKVLCGFVDGLDTLAGEDLSK